MNDESLFLEVKINKIIYYTKHVFYKDCIRQGEGMGFDCFDERRERDGLLDTGVTGQTTLPGSRVEEGWTGDEQSRKCTANRSV